jgi:hypothetical protein
MISTYLVPPSLEFVAELIADPTTVRRHRNIVPELVIRESVRSLRDSRKSHRRNCPRDIPKESSDRCLCAEYPNALNDISQYGGFMPPFSDFLPFPSLRAWASSYPPFAGGFA